MRRLSLILGTRPEAIKLCPLVLALRDHPDFEPHVCVTGQHRQMLDQVLEVFDVRPHADLNLMQPNQSLASFSARAISACDAYLAEAKPDAVLVQGDTTTVFCAALAAFYRRIPVGHVEAGLRTWNKYAPFPEEINRGLTTRLADYHFAPTEQARKNLLRDGVADEAIFVTGNTVIDALLLAVEKVRCRAPEIPGLARHVGGASGRRLVLITAHRRENFGAGFESICAAIAHLAGAYPDVDFVYPVHLNPQVREPVNRILAGRDNIHLIEPLGYLPFVWLMDQAHLILTDSGGVQEEAPSLGKPVLVMRETTERPEAVAMGTVRLVGTDPRRIVQEVSRLLDDADAYQTMARRVSPYGDGQACSRILNALRRWPCVSPRTGSSCESPQPGGGLG
jgi:UDP-N-acetylglucosamine 2-epimerase (non-hydrolysing)